MIPLDGIEDREVSGFRCTDVGDCYCWRCGLKSFTLDETIEVWEVYTESNMMGIIFSCDNDGYTPICGLCLLKPWDSKSSSSDLVGSMYAYGMVRGVLTRKGLASSAITILKVSPGMLGRQTRRETP